MNAVLTLYRTTVGKKVVMAVTGMIMVGWLTAHMVGNLQVFLSPEAFNHYAELIQSQKELLWIMRLGMLTTIVLHIWSVLALMSVSRAARPQGYAAGRKTQASSPAARSMRWGGLMLVLFLVWHLADLTIGVKAVNPAFHHGQAFGNLTGSLTRIPVTILYVVANLALGMHIWHGVSSVFNTLGINQIGSRVTASQTATAIACFIAGGNILIALGVLAGLGGILGVTP